MNIVCLKWGDKFSHEHVNRLYRMVCKNFKEDFNFICYTENANGIDSNIIIQPLGNYDLERWWWKLSLFENPTKVPTIFFDLDVVIQNNITHLKDYCENNKICTVKAYWKPWAENSTPKPPGFDMNLNSSVMIWTGDLTNIWMDFISDPERYMFTYNGIDSFLYFHHQEKLNWLNPGEVYSRVYGYDENNWYKFNPKYHNDHKLFYKPDFNICIFNGLYQIKERGNYGNFVVIDDTSYEGYEGYWND